MFIALKVRGCNDLAALVLEQAWQGVFSLGPFHSLRTASVNPPDNCGVETWDFLEEELPIMSSLHC